MVNTDNCAIQTNIFLPAKRCGGFDGNPDARIIWKFVFYNSQLGKETTRAWTASAARKQMVWMDFCWMESVILFLTKLCKLFRVHPLKQRTVALFLQMQLPEVVEHVAGFLSLGAQVEFVMRVGRDDNRDAPVDGNAVLTLQKMITAKPSEGKRMQAVRYPASLPVCPTWHRPR